MSDAEFRKAIKGLRPKQIGVLHAIAIGHDSCHHSATLDVLEKRGLIESREERLTGGFAVIIKRYAMPIHVHIPYCEWVSAQSGVKLSRSQKA